MARKFSKSEGLSKIFTSSGTTLDLNSIKPSMANQVNANSILFLTATSDDVQYGYPIGSKYIWTQGILYPTNDFNISDIVVNSSTPKYLDGSLNGNTIEYGVKIQDISASTE